MYFKGIGLEVSTGFIRLRTDTRVGISLTQQGSLGSCSMRGLPWVLAQRKTSQVGLGSMELVKQSENSRVPWKFRYEFLLQAYISVADPCPPRLETQRAEGKLKLHTCMQGRCSFLGIVAMLRVVGLERFPFTMTAHSAFRLLITVDSFPQVKAAGR
jgi:hypothetical protein